MTRSVHEEHEERAHPVVAESLPHLGEEDRREPSGMPEPLVAVPGRITGSVCGARSVGGEVRHLSLGIRSAHLEKLPPLPSVVSVIVNRFLLHRLDRSPASRVAVEGGARCSGARPSCRQLRRCACVPAAAGGADPRSACHGAPVHPALRAGSHAGARPAPGRPLRAWCAGAPARITAPHASGPAGWPPGALSPVAGPIAARAAGLRRSVGMHRAGSLGTHPGVDVLRGA